MKKKLVILVVLTIAIIILAITRASTSFSLVGVIFLLYIGKWFLSKIFLLLSTIIKLVLGVILLCVAVKLILIF